MKALGSKGFTFKVGEPEFLCFKGGSISSDSCPPGYVYLQLVTVIFPYLTSIIIRLMWTLFRLASVHEKVRYYWNGVHLASYPIRSSILDALDTCVCSERMAAVPNQNHQQRRFPDPGLQHTYHFQ